MDLADLTPRPKTVRCAKCKRSIRLKPTGRIPTFCSPACRQSAFRIMSRKPKPPPAPPADWQTMHESQHRALTWKLLQDAGLVPVDQPPPPKQE